MYSVTIFLVLITTSLGLKPIGTVEVKGVLTSKNGDAIPGCNVVIKGKSESVNTGTCGEFEIEVSENYDEVLVFSCMTYRVWEMKTEKFKGNIVTIICLEDWRKFEDGPCGTNYRKESRVKIR